MGGGGSPRRGGKGDSAGPGGTEKEDEETEHVVSK